VTKDVRRSSSSSIVILSYPQYCRYRAVQRRLETAPGSGGSASQHSLAEDVLRAIGRPASVGGVARVMFCRSTFCHPELDEHEFRRDLLSTSLSVCWSLNTFVFCRCLSILYGLFMMCIIYAEKIQISQTSNMSSLC